MTSKPGTQAPWQRHGELQVSDDGHRLEHSDGTPFFLLGDTAWKLPTLNAADIERYFSTRSDQGFNTVLVNLTGMKSQDSAGEWPFLGDGPPWSSFEPNEAYWRRIDRLFDVAESAGVYLVALPWWGPHADSDSERQFFADPDSHNLEFGKFLGSRYGGRPNLIWCLAGEYSKPMRLRAPAPLPEIHRRRLELVGAGIRSTAVSRRLMTIHPASLFSSSDDFHEADWLDFNMIQTHKGFDYIVPLLAADYCLEPARPVLSAEAWYEDEPRMYDLPAWDDMDPAWLQRMQAYWSVFHGSFGFVYGHGKVWRMEDEEGNRGKLPQRALMSDAARSLKHLRTLMEHDPDAKWQPHQPLLTTGSIGSDFGRFFGTSPSLNCALISEDRCSAMVYCTRGMPFCARMSQLAPGTATWQWFDPSGGTWSHDASAEDEAVTGSGAPPCWFSPPAGEGDGNDRVLVIKVR